MQTCGIFQVAGAKETKHQKNAQCRAILGKYRGVYFVHIVAGITTELPQYPLCTALFYTIHKLLTIKPTSVSPTTSVVGSFVL